MFFTQRTGLGGPVWRKIQDASGKYLENILSGLLLFGCIVPCLKCPQMSHCTGGVVSLQQCFKLEVGVSRWVHSYSLRTQRNPTLSRRIKEFLEILDSFRYSAM